MRAADLSPDRRKRLVPVPGSLHPNVKALVPPPAPREIDAREVLGPLLAAEGAVATVAAVARRLPQPDLITRSLERREAVLSSQIEGTHTDLTQLLEYEATGSGEDLPPDAPVTLGYVRALDHGLRVVRRDGTKGLTLDLIRDLHRVLMDGTIYPYFEGSGASRLIQNWIGGGGRIEDAILVPAPTDHLEECLTDLERFLRADLDSPALLALPLRMAIAHAQFEAIHPFSDGNGKVGRLLPPLMLAAEGLPPLYLAGYLKSNQRMDHDRLAGVQLRGEWTPWLRFFLAGIKAAASNETETAAALLAVRSDWQDRTVHVRSNAAAKRLLDVFLGAPVQTVASASKALGVSIPAANHGIDVLVRRGILNEMTGRRWRRTFQAHQVIAVLEHGPEVAYQ